MEKENANAGKNYIKNILMETVKCLAESWDISEALFTSEYICAIYNAKNKTVNPARVAIFTKKH